MMQSLWFIFYTECTLLLRRSHAWAYPVIFFVIVTCLFPLALTPDPIFLEKYIPGCIWIAALLSSLLSIENVFMSDLEEGQLEQYILSDLALTLIILSKLIAQWIVTELPIILLTPLLGWFFHLSTSSILILCASLLFGTPILTLIGSLGVALTIGLRQAGMMIGLIILPLLIPVLIFGASVVQQSQAGFNITGPLAFLAGLSIFAITTLPFAIAATLRVGMDE